MLEYARGTLKIPVEVVGEKYTTRKDDCVTLRPWSPKRVLISARTRVERRPGLRCEGDGREKRM